MRMILGLVLVPLTVAAALARSPQVRHMPSITRSFHASTASAARIQPTAFRPVSHIASGIRASGAHVSGVRATGIRASNSRPAGIVRGRTSYASMTAGRKVMRRDDPPAPTADPGPPIVEGQLIRTEGLGAIVSEPSEPARLFAVEAGDRIGISEGRVTPQMNSRGTFVGPRDTLPPPNPAVGSSGGASGGNAITPRTDTGN